jgi:hypothetical protein
VSSELRKYLEDFSGKDGPQDERLKDYHYQARFKNEVDYKAIIEKGKEWDDHEFMIGEFAMIDLSMQKHIDADDWR